jgi:hypothetical protein
MKKMFLSAIVMLAFSAASMANTVEVTEVKEEVVATVLTTDEDVVKRTVCDTIWIYYYEQAIGEGGMCAGSMGAWDYADNLSAMNGC